MPTRLKTIVDTNMLVAYALLPPDVPRRHRAVADCVEWVLTHTEPLVSAATAAELAHVLMRPDYDRFRPPDARRAFLRSFLEQATMIGKTPVVRLCRDPDDDMFLSLALGGGADWLISLDKRVLAVRAVGRTRIVHPNGFLRAVGDIFSSAATDAHGIRADLSGITSDGETPYPCRTGTAAADDDHEWRSGPAGGTAGTQPD